MDDAQHGHHVHWVVSHLSWCPTRRRQVRVGPLRTRLAQRSHAVAVAHGWPMLRRASPPDYMHLLIRANPHTVPADMPRRSTGRRASRVREESHHARRTLPARWTRSFLLSTAGTT
jgi:REP element-mobilizing transposase RayT